MRLREEGEITVDLPKGGSAVGSNRRTSFKSEEPNILLILENCIACIVNLNLVPIFQAISDMQGKLQSNLKDLLCFHSARQNALFCKTNPANGFLVK